MNNGITTEQQQDQLVWVWMRWNETHNSSGLTYHPQLKRVLVTSYMMKICWQCLTKLNIFSPRYRGFLHDIYLFVCNHYVLSWKRTIFIFSVLSRCIVTNMERWVLLKMRMKCSRYKVVMWSVLGYLVCFLTVTLFQWR